MEVHGELLAMEQSCVHKSRCSNYQKNHTYIACMCRRHTYGYSVCLCVYILTADIKASNLNRNF